MSLPWRPRSMPDFRRRLVNDLRAPRSALRGVDHGPFMRTVDLMPEQIANGELYWVTKEMTPWALDASHDVPMGTILANHMPALSGLLLFEDGLPDVESTMFGPDPVPVPLDGLSWSIVDSLAGRALLIMALTRRERIPEPIRELHGHLLFSIVSSGAILLEKPLDEDPIVPPSTLGLIDLLAATWVIMQTPTMTDTRRLPPDKRHVRVARDRKEPPPRDVKIIELRRLAYRPTEPGETDEHGRVYRHQWVVRGHPRNQAYGPGRSLHRVVYIPPYTKGPEGAPMLPTEHVNVWRR